MTRRQLSAAAFVLALWSPALQAQSGAPTAATSPDAPAASVSAIAIPDAIACPPCLVRRVPLAVLHSEAATGAIRRMPRAVRIDPAGRVWVISDSQPLRVYAATGRFLGAVGERGTLPRQYRAPVDLVWTPGDSMLVLEGVRSPALLFSPQWNFVRRVHLPAQLQASAVLSWPNAVLAHGSMWNANRPAPPVHLVSFDTYGAEIVRSYGAPRAVTSSTGVDVHFTSAGGGRVVTAPASRYLLQRWNAQGALEQSWVRRPYWFRDSSSTDAGSARVAPSPAIAALEFTTDSLLWVYTHVPSPTWRSAWARDTPAHERLFHTRVEVLDLARGRVVARVDLDAVVISLAGDQRVALLSPGTPGLPKLSVERLELVWPR